MNAKGRPKGRPVCLDRFVYRRKLTDVITFSHSDCRCADQAWSELQLTGTTFPHGVSMSPRTPWMLARSRCVALKSVISPGYPSSVALLKSVPIPGLAASHSTDR